MSKTSLAFKGNANLLVNNSKFITTKNAKFSKNGF